MSTKVKELEPRRNGDRGACGICNPKPDRISESSLWSCALAQDGPVEPLRKP